MTKGTGIELPSGERIGAVHLGNGKLKGAEYTVADPQPGNPFNRKTITAAEAHKKLKALKLGVTLDEAAPATPAAVGGGS